MKVLIINSVPYGSTASISCGISRIVREAGLDAEVAFGYSYHPIKEKYTNIGGYWNKAIHLILSRFTGLHGVFSSCATRRFLRHVREFNPEIIHFHNLHGWYINIPMLLEYVNRNNVKVVWTLHDCWPLTGHCPHYDMIGCDKWKTECNHCPIYDRYPKSYIDASQIMHRLKKKWFSSIKDLTIVSPSEWLAKQVKQSYLKDNRCIVINNGIDLSKYDIRHNVIKNNTKFQILGVSFGWDEKKGLDVFIDLANLLDEHYEITLVGTDGNVDKILPTRIKSIHRTQNEEELIELYNKSDVFVNASREENFPTVNIEAIACGLPIITFNTGGSPEIIDETCGVVVPKNDIHALAEAIIEMSINPISKDLCRSRAMRYDRQNKFKEYLMLYKQLYDDK